MKIPQGDKTGIGPPGICDICLDIKTLNVYYEDGVNTYLSPAVYFARRFVFIIRIIFITYQ